MLKTRVGVFGCCVSRDVFNSQIIKDYKDYFYLTFSYAGDSIINIFQNPIEFNDKDIKLKPYDRFHKLQEKQISQGLRKDFFKDLDETQIQYLIFDNANTIRWPLIKYNNTYLLKHLYLPETNFYRNLKNYEEINIVNATEEILKLYKDSCDKFFKILEEKYPEITVVLNPTRTGFRSLENNRIKINDNFRQIPFNQFFPILDGYILKNFDVEVMDFNNDVIINPEHVWGEHELHYSRDYYESFKNQLRYIIDRNEKLSQIDPALNKQIRYDARRKMYHKTFMEAKAYMLEYDKLYPNGPVYEDNFLGKVQSIFGNSNAEEERKKKFKLLNSIYEAPVEEHLNDVYTYIMDDKNQSKKRVHIELFHVDKLKEVELGKKLFFKARCIDEYGKIIPNIKVALNIKTDTSDKTFGEKFTDAEGVARYNFTLNTFNKYPVEFAVVHEESDEYKSAVSNVVLIKTVKKIIPTKIEFKSEYDNKEVILGETVDFEATITDDKNNPLANEPIYLNIKTDTREQSYDAKKTDENGKISLNFKLAMYNENPIEFSMNHDANDTYGYCESNVVKIKTVKSKVR